MNTNNTLFLNSVNVLSINYKRKHSRLRGAFKLIVHFMVVLGSIVSCDQFQRDNEVEKLGTVRYNSLIATSADISNNIRYGENRTQDGSLERLTMDIYEPESDTTIKRPLIVLAHGGSFLRGDKDEFEELATYLARSGYIVASIEYRLLDIEMTERSIKRAVIDAVFDMKAAVRFFRMDANSNNEYRVDVDNIFVGGYSAGAFTGLHYGYLSSEDEIRKIGGSSLVAYVAERGGLEGDSGNPGVPSDVKGILNFAGALTDVGLIDSKNAPILYSIHGTDDEVVPFGEGEADGTGVITFGSGPIHATVSSVGLTNELMSIDGAGHDALQECPTCPSEIRAFIFKHL